MHDPGNSSGPAEDPDRAPAADASASPEEGEVSASAEEGTADAPGDAPRKRRRKRKRKRTGDEPAPAIAPAPDVAATMASLSSGLFSHIDERQVPCRIDGCDRTWTWTAGEQIQAFGQPPPRRLCPEHESRVGSIDDRQVPCINPGCEKTWTFTRAAAMAQLSRTGSPEPARRMCDDCAHEEKALGDREVSCRIDACRRTWTWTAEAQLKHRNWLRHAPDGGGGKAKRGRRGRRRGSVHETPSRLCEPCHQKLGKLSPRPGPCKVHGCTRTAMVDKEQQLRAWAALHTEDLETEGTLSRRMCEVCREFCRAHPDREVACGRPACDKTWTYKTGAQLQAFLAGRHDDPIRLCDACVRGGFAREPKGPGGSEIMPCVVPLCEGVWYYTPGTQLAPAALGQLPIDRMCEAHRREHAPAEDMPTGSDDPSATETDASEVADATETTDAPAS